MYGFVISPPSPPTPPPPSLYLITHRQDACNFFTYELDTIKILLIVNTFIFPEKKK